MEQRNIPIDCISVTDISGNITPLRFRVAQERQEQLRIDVSRVLDIRRIPYVGAEAQIFLCQAKINGLEQTIQLKYVIRSHCWFLL